VTMNVQTADTTPTGPHTLTVTASGTGAPDKTTDVTLNVQNHVPFTISGSASGVSPGADTALDLELTNPYNFALQVTGLSVSLNDITGAGTANGGCDIADFSVNQISGVDLSTSPVTLPANGTNVKLSTLLPGGASLPSVHMANTNVSQDDCQGATVNFNFSGTSQK
jgi:hypothetical protein